MSAVVQIFRNDARRAAKHAAMVTVRRLLGRYADVYVDDVRRTVCEFISDYDANQVTEQEVERGFSYLLRTGLIWQLPGRYGRIARALAAADQI